MQAVGIIGIGEIGWRIGKLLHAAGHRVIAYDIAAEARARGEKSGFTVAAGIPELCGLSDVVITCVTDGAALKDVVASASGVAYHLAAGRPLIDTTSAEPWITHEIAPLLAKAGVPFLDAPVSGGVPAAETGRMNFMVGGDIGLLDRCRPVLQRLGPVITHVGPNGAGHTIKAVNMLALATSMLCASELLALGVSSGASLKDLVQRLDSGTGESYSTRVHFPKFIVPGNYASGFTFDLMLKDLSIGIGIANNLDIPLFLQRNAYEQYRAAANTGFRGQDNTRMVEAILSSAPEPKSGAPDEALFKAIEMAAAFSNIVIAAESICLARAAGIAPRTTIEILSAGSGDSYALSRLIPPYLYDENDKAGHSLKTNWEAMTSLADRFTAPTISLSLFRQTTSILASTMLHYGPHADSRCVLELLSKWTGIGEFVHEKRESVR